MSGEPELIAGGSFSLRWKDVGEALAERKKNNAGTTAIKRRERWGRSLDNGRAIREEDECADILGMGSAAGLKEGRDQVGDRLDGLWM